MLHQLEKLAFKQISCIYPYFWALPINWNKDYSELMLIDKRKMAPFAISMFFLLLLGLGLFVLTFVLINGTFHVKFGRMNAATLCVTGAACLAVTSSAYLTARNALSILSGCNGIFQLYQNLLSGKIYLQFQALLEWKI